MPTLRNARNARQVPAQPLASAPPADQPTSAGQFSTAQFTSPANQSVALTPGKIGSASGGAGRDLGPVATGAIVAVLGGLAVVGAVAVGRYDPLAATGATPFDVEIREVGQPPTPPKTETAAAESLSTDQSEDGPGTEPKTEPNDGTGGESSPLARLDEESAADTAGSPTTVPPVGDRRRDKATMGAGSGSDQADASGSSPAPGAAGIAGTADSPTDGDRPSGSAGVSGTSGGGSDPAVGSEPAGSVNDPPAADAPEKAAATPRTPSEPPAPVQQSASPAPTIVERTAAIQPVPVAAPVQPVVFEGQVTAVIEWSLGGGAEPSGFVVSWSGGGRSNEETLGANARRTQLPDLVPGTPHSATIVPLGPEGSPRPESALTVSFRTLDADVGPPRPAEDLVVAAGPDRLTVSWTSEIDDPGTTGYFVSWGCCGGRVGGKSVFPGDGQASFTIEGLQSGVLYQIDILTLGANFVADPATSRRVSGTPE